MFNTLSLGNVRVCAALPVRFKPGRLTPLVLAGAALVTAVLATAPRQDAAPSVSAAHPAATLIESAGGSTVALQAASDLLRAELRALPGVGAVEMRGLQTAGIEIRYTPSRLAEAGVRPADLLTSLPAQASSPGVITVHPDLAQGGLATVANMPVRAGQHVLRLGDVTLVARTPLPTPVARLFRNGHPAVELVVTPAQGEAGPALDRRIAKTLAATPLPSGVTMN